MSAAEVLVIFLSVALAIFLALAIVLTIYLIIIAKKIKRITDTAEEGVRGLVAAAAAVQRAIAPAVVTRFVSDIVNRFTDKKRKKEEED